MKARREMETKLTKYGHVTQEDLETSSSKMELSIGKVRNGMFVKEFETIFYLMLS